MKGLKNENRMTYNFICEMHAKLLYIIKTD